MKKMFLASLIAIVSLAVNAQTDSLQQYTGKYKFPDGSVVGEITVTIENGMLMATSTMGTTELRPTGTADVFEIVAYGGTATFNKVEGKIKSVQILVGDVNIVGEKTESLHVESRNMATQNVFPDINQ